MIARCPSRARGLSLVELLVVLAIIAVLIAVLLPTLGLMRDSTRRTVCASNLRQIGQSLTMYRQEDASRRLPPKNFMPPPFYRPDPSHTSPPQWLYDYLEPYLPRDSDVFRCPADDGLVADRVAAASSDGVALSYWYHPLPDSLPPDHPYADKPGSWEYVWDYYGDTNNGNWAFHRGGGMNQLRQDGGVVFVEP